MSQELTARLGRVLQDAGVSETLVRCPFCGLGAPRPHGSDTECIAALRREIARVNIAIGLAYPRSA
ncbi:hypothetical protein BH24ACI4_BH24ACI4_22860 [soil metagenome]